MQKTVGDIFFNELKERYNFLNFLPLENVFSLFSIKTYNERYTEEECRNLSKGNNGNCDLHALCLSLHTILQLLGSLFNTEHLHTTISWCDYLSYWIYDYIKNSTSCNDYPEFYDKLKLLMSKYLSEYNCNIIYPKIEHDKLTDKKKISLYSEILYWIKNAYNSIFYFDDPMIYNQYLDECFRFYKKVMCSDDSYIKENYKSQLQEFKNNFNEAITFLKGKNISIPKVDLPLDEELMCTMEWPKVKAEGDDVNGEVEGGEKPRKKEAKPEGQAGLSGERGSPESSGQTVIEESENGRSGLAEAGGLGDQEEGSTVQESEEGPTVPKKPQMLHHGGENDLISDGTMVRGIDGETSESILPKNVGTIGATLAGSSIFLLMMYKYTPLGSWVSTKILGRNKLMENMRKNNYELLLNDVGNHEASLNDTMYHISYNSSSNQ